MTDCVQPESGVAVTERVGACCDVESHNRTLGVGVCSAGAAMEGDGAKAESGMSATLAEAGGLRLRRAQTAEVWPMMLQAVHVARIAGQAGCEAEPQRGHKRCR